jgi:hypothetical protein
MAAQIKLVVVLQDFGEIQVETVEQEQMELPVLLVLLVRQVQPDKQIIISNREHKQEQELMVEVEKAASAVAVAAASIVDFALTVQETAAAVAAAAAKVELVELVVLGAVVLSESIFSIMV